MCFTEIFFGTARKDPNEKWLSRKHIIEGTKASCKRFGFDYVDIVYAHRPDVNTPMEEIVRAFNWVIEHGYACVSITASKNLMLTPHAKRFYWGVSEWSAQQIQEAYLIAEKLHLIGPATEVCLVFRLLGPDFPERVS